MVEDFAPPGLPTPGLPTQDCPPTQCSAKGCRAAALWQLRWNNPKIHTPEYRKTWLACADHRPTLGGFLELRGFLREVSPFPAASAAPIS